MIEGISAPVVILLVSTINLLSLQPLDIPRGRYIVGGVELLRRDVIVDRRRIIVIVAVIVAAPLI